MKHRLDITALALVTAALLSACGGPSETDLLASARSAMDKKEHRAAIIQLKSALQKDGQSGEARYLLGKALSETGDFVAASVELRKANDLKYKPALVVPALARSLLAQGESRAVVTQFADVKLADAAAQADMLVSLAAAYLTLEQKPKAMAVIAEAQAAVPNHPGAGLLLARVAAQEKNLPKALELVDAAIAQDANLADAWLLKAELLMAGNGDRKVALEACRKAIALRPTLIQAHMLVIAELMHDGDMAAVATQVDELKKILPNHPRTRLIEAELAYRNKDFKTASDKAKQVVQALPNNPQALQMAGAAEFQLKSYQQAETYLAKGLQLSPDLPLARRMLARIYLRTGQPQKASTVLQPEVARAGADPQVLQMAAEAFLQSGDAKEAEALFQRAAKIKPDDPRIRTALALTQFNKGKADSAISELESIASADGGGLADMALVAAHLRRKDFDKALKVIDGLERKQPDKPLAPLLRGRVLAMRNDPVGSRAAFERSAKIDPLYFPAVASLAAVDLAEGKVDAARKRFDEVLARDPKHLQATLSLAALLARTGNSGDEVTRLLRSAVQLAPGDPRTHLQLVQHLMERRETKAALTAAREGNTAMPDHPEMLLALGRTFMAADDMQQAVTTFNRLASVQPKSAMAFLGLADVNIKLQDRAAATRNLKRALELSPGLVPAQRGLVAMAVADKRPQDAIDIARQVQKERPEEALGFMLEGDVEASRKNTKGAQALYQTALRKKSPGETVMRVHDLLLGAGQAGEADAMARKWIAEHPTDVGFQFYLADRALAAKEFVKAEAYYNEVLKLQPANALALNNLSWLMVKLSKGGAVEYAEKANKLLPGRPALMDTLATALAYERQMPRAVDVQKQAVEKAPEDGGLRVNLAKLYLQTNQKTLARSELERVAKMGRQYGGQAEVQELLKTF